MKKWIVIALLLISAPGFTQVFISKGMIEYEVKVNIHKSMGEGMWADMMKDKIPKLSTSFYNLTFTPEQSLYQYNRSGDVVKVPSWFSNNEEDNIWFNDYNAESFTQQKNVFGDSYLLKDSLMNIKWKITNENREIAGFNCRKAVAVLFDSVYVFAFYTDEITVSGGPMSLHGLPGMILGVTIPRMFSSWIATKVQVAGVDEKMIIAPKRGKQKKASELKGTVEQATKEWGSYGQQRVWGMFL